MPPILYLHTGTTTYHLKLPRAKNFPVFAGGEQTLYLPLNRRRWLCLVAGWVLFRAFAFLRLLLLGRSGSLMYDTFCICHARLQPCLERTVRLGSSRYYRALVLYLQNFRFTRALFNGSIPKARIFGCVPSALWTFSGIVRSAAAGTFSLYPHSLLY